MELEIKQKGNNLTYLIDEKVVADDSSLWTYDTPEKLSHDTWHDIDAVFNGDLGKIKFYGTRVTFERLKSLLPKNNNFSIDFVDKKLGVSTNYESDLNQWFKQVLASDLLTPTKKVKIKKRYLEAKENVFVVNVLAKVSAGKSTLINALLGQELMPSSNNAETAKVTKIVDNDSAKTFSATALDENDLPIVKIDNLDLQKMDQLNDDSSIASVRIDGDVPFASSIGYSLELVDTPGPDNVINTDHHIVFENLITQQNKNGFKPLVVYVIPADAIGTKDTDELLDVIREQSITEHEEARKNRFIFVISKMDGVNSDEVKRTLDSMHGYLTNKGIVSPIIIPVAAKLALQIREYQSGRLTDEDEIDQLKLSARKQNRHTEFHFDEIVTNQVNEADNDIDSLDAALQYSGIPLLEAKLSEYVNEYAAPERLLRLDNLANNVIHEIADTNAITDDLANKKDELNKAQKEIADIRNSMSAEARELQKTKLIDIDNVKNESQTIMSDQAKKIDNKLDKTLSTFNPESMDERTEILTDVTQTIAEDVANSLKTAYRELTDFGDKYDFDAEKNFEVTRQTQKLLLEGLVRIGNMTAVPEEEISSQTNEKTQSELKKYVAETLSLVWNFMQSGLDDKITALKTNLANEIEGLEKSENAKQAELDKLAETVEQDKALVKRLTITAKFLDKKPELKAD